MSSAKKKAQPNITRQALSQDVEQFLKDGGKIDKVSSGISGQPLGAGGKAISSNNKK